MHSQSFRLLAASALALTMTLAAPGSSIAQRTKGDEGTGGAAGYSPPPVDTGPAADAPAARSMTAPAPPPADAGQAAPAPEATPPDETKPEDGIKPPADYQPD